MSSADKIKAYAIMGQGQPVQDWEYTAIPLGNDQVEVEILACGVCHSDVHQQQNDWGIAVYPLVVGHEIIGRVCGVGKNVESLTLGQRVGVGPQTGNCGKCRECQEPPKGTPSNESCCSKKDKSYNSKTGNPIQPMTYGGFADKIRVRADWAFPIPDKLDTVDAAPLMCAGVTTWSPFVKHKINSSHAVGIIGIGGLGHIAVQFAAALGCSKVTAISHTSNKAEQAKALGATSFLNTSEQKEMDEQVKSFDFLLSTVSAEIDWTPFLKLLKVGGTLCMVGLPNTVKFNPMLLVANKLSVSGSYLASREEICQMLELCAEKKIKAMTEVMPMDSHSASAALDRVAKNLPRYRIVLKKA